MADRNILAVRDSNPPKVGGIQTWTMGYSGGATEPMSCRAQGKGLCSPQGIYQVASLSLGVEPCSNKQLCGLLASNNLSH